MNKNNTIQINARKKNNGFTLLEVIIALAIVSTGIAAVIASITNMTNSVSTSERALISTWLTTNQFTEIKVLNKWPNPGVTQNEKKMGGRTWYLSIDTTTTENDDIRQITIHVFEDQEQQHLTHTATGFITVK